MWPGYSFWTYGWPRLVAVAKKKGSARLGCCIVGLYTVRPAGRVTSCSILAAAMFGLKV